MRELSRAGASEAVLTREEALKRLTEIVRKEQGMLVIAAVRAIGRMSGWCAPDVLPQQDLSNPHRCIIYLPQPIPVPIGHLDLAIP